METSEKGQQKRCIHCGRFFTPDRRAWKRQVTCLRKACRTKQKRESQRKWVAANPGCFNGRYENTKQWREEHPGYQREWRAKKGKIRGAMQGEIQDGISPAKPLRIIRLVIPEVVLRGEIQDEIRLVRQSGHCFFVAGRGMQDTRRDGLQEPLQISSPP